MKNRSIDTAKAIHSVMLRIMTIRLVRR